MGKRGPKPLPANVLALRGGSAYLQNRMAEQGAAIQPDVELPDWPKHLLPEAKKEWKRVGPQLEAQGIVSQLDRTALSLYCQDYAWLVWYENLLQRDFKLAAQREADFLANPANAGKPWLGGDGLMLPTPNGSWTYNPHWVARNKHALYVDRFLASFGMSPSARGRVTASTRQLPLPGITPPSGGFNDL